VDVQCAHNPEEMAKYEDRSRRMGRYDTSRFVVMSQLSPNSFCSELVELLCSKYEIYGPQSIRKHSRPTQASTDAGLIQHDEDNSSVDPEVTKITPNRKKKKKKKRNLTSDVEPAEAPAVESSPVVDE
jgi:hypothetical protein